MSKKNKNKNFKKIENTNKVISSYEELITCEDNQILEKTLEEKKIEIEVENIYLRVLENNILKVNNEILEVQKKQLESKEFQDNEYSLKLQELEKSKEVLVKEYEEKSLLLEQEYEQKNDNLDKLYEDKTNLLFNEYQERFKLLDDEREKLKKDFEEKTKELEKEYFTKECFLRDYEKDIEENNVKQYNELMEKINDSKNKFEALMKEQRELFDKEVELKNIEIKQEIDKLNEELKIKELEINNDYNSKMDSLKQSEIEFLQKEHEFNEKVVDLNNKIKEFYDNKRKFVKRHYLVRRFYNYTKKHKIKISIFISALFLILVYFSLIFQYNLFRKDFVSSAISNADSIDSYDNTISIYLDTSNSSLARFVDLNGLKIRLNYKYNKFHYQNLNTFSLGLGDNNYKWERYYKNDTMIARTPYYGQYIIVENFKNNNYSFDKNEETKIFKESLRKFLSNKNNFDFNEVNRLNVEENASFFNYLKQAVFLSSNYNYYYNLTCNDSEECNELFKNVFNIFLDSQNFESFNLEENDFQRKLGMTDVLGQSKDILLSIIQYSNVEDIDLNIKIVEGNLINIADICFNLLYQDDTMVNPIPMTIRVTYDFNKLEDERSLESNSFTTNAIFFESLSK